MVIFTKDMKRLDGCTSSWSGANLNIKNLDVVDLEAVNIYCSSINIDGEQIDVKPMKHITEDETSTTIDSDLIVTGLTAASSVTCTNLLINGRDIDDSITALNGVTQDISHSVGETTISNVTNTDVLTVNSLTVNDSVTINGLFNYQKPFVNVRQVWSPAITLGDGYDFISQSSGGTFNILECLPTQLDEDVVDDSYWDSNHYRIPLSGFYKIHAYVRGVEDPSQFVDAGMKVIAQTHGDGFVNLEPYDGIVRFTSSNSDSYSAMQYTTIAHLLKDETVHLKSYVNDSESVVIYAAEMSIEYISS